MVFRSLFVVRGTSPESLRPCSLLQLTYFLQFICDIETQKVSKLGCVPRCFHLIFILTIQGRDTKGLIPDVLFMYKITIECSRYHRCQSAWPVRRQSCLGYVGQQMGRGCEQKNIWELGAKHWYRSLWQRISTGQIELNN